MEKSIIATLGWFDLFDYPLKKEELIRYLFGYRSKDKVTQEYISDYVHRSEDLSRQIVFDGEYFCLRHRDLNRLIKIREQREKYSRQKISKAYRVFYFLRFIPYIKAIFICNNLGYLNADLGSDIDLFIVAEKRRIWSARFYLTGVLKIFNMRPKFDFSSFTSLDRKDKIDVNFYITEDSLDLSAVRFQNLDIYLIYWLHQLIPIYDVDGVHSRLMRANQWTREFLPFAQNIDRYRRLRSYEFIRKALLKSSTSLEERIWKKIQMKYLSKNIHTFKNREGVIISDNMIKLHFIDRRREYYKKWEDNLRKYGIFVSNKGILEREGDR